MPFEEKNLKPLEFNLPQKNNSRCFLWNGDHKIFLTHAAPEYQLKSRAETGDIFKLCSNGFGNRIEKNLLEPCKANGSRSPLAESIVLK
jgi:hypothetical protein